LRSTSSERESPRDLDEKARDRRLARAGEAAGDDESGARPRASRGELDVLLDLPRKSIRSARLGPG
jgi:hypothetical protein